MWAIRRMAVGHGEWAKAGPEGRKSRRARDDAISIDAYAPDLSHAYALHTPSTSSFSGPSKPAEVGNPTERGSNPARIAPDLNGPVHGAPRFSPYRPCADRPKRCIPRLTSVAALFLNASAGFPENAEVPAASDPQRSWRVTAHRLPV